jgi:hypothetical protein
MPLTDDQLNNYEQFLRRKADTDSQQQLGQLGGMIGDYGSQSMTSSANKYNNDRQEDYLNAMAKREDLAQKWQQTASQRALTQGQIKNMNAENQARLSSAALEKGKAFTEQERFNQQYLLDRSKHQLEQDKFANDARQQSLNNATAAAQARHNYELENGHLNLAEWTARTNALLSRAGINIDSEKLRQHEQELRHYYDQDGRLVNPDGAMRLFHQLMRENVDDGGIAAAAGVPPGALAARADAIAQRTAARQGQVAALDAQGRALVMNALQGIGYPLMMGDLGRR